MFTIIIFALSDMSFCLNPIKLFHSFNTGIQLMTQENWAKKSAKPRFSVYFVCHSRVVYLLAFFVQQNVLLPQAVTQQALRWVKKSY